MKFVTLLNLKNIFYDLHYISCGLGDHKNNSILRSPENTFSWDASGDKLWNTLALNNQYVSNRKVLGIKFWFWLWICL